jgi:S-layer family protein
MRFPTAVRACLTVMFMLPAAAFAQVSSPQAKVLTQEYRVESAQIQPETYGTSSLTYVALSPWDFRPIDSTVTYAFSGNNGISRTNNSGSTQFEAPLRLPEGATVSYLEMYSCTPSVGSITSAFRGLKTDGSWSSFTGPINVPAGCGVTSTTISPVVIDNTTTTYTVDANLSQFVSLAGYRVGYKLQISPDPATATFADVPVGHPFHRFVEALYASGITGGCGGGNFCPDAPVTRGQMAVFLAGALGLHWAP